MDKLLKVAAVVAVAALFWACRRTARGSAAELLAAIDGGGLLARRAAIKALADSPPRGVPELWRVWEASRQWGRLRLREAALSSLARTSAGSAPMRAALLEVAGDFDGEVAAAAVGAALRSGIPRGDPSLNSALRRFPWLSPPPEAAPAPAAVEEARRRAAAVEAALGEVRPEAYPRLLEEARRAAGAGDLAAIDRLLSDRTFLWGGAQSGEALAPAGAGLLGRAEALARSGDPMKEDVGLGAIAAMADPAARRGLERLSKDPDERLAVAAKGALR